MRNCWNCPRSRDFQCFSSSVLSSKLLNVNILHDKLTDYFLNNISILMLIVVYLSILIKT